MICDIVFQGICDGAGCVIVASEDAVKQHNLTPLARIAGYAVAGQFLVLQLQS